MTVQHLDGHPHAFVNNSGTVVNVAVFDDHIADTINFIRESHYSDTTVVCCCVNGDANLGDTWDGKKFISAPVQDPTVYPVKE
jgi:hypothetical protein